MKCAWQAYLNILPQWMRSDVDGQGRDCLQELRLRANAPPELVLSTGRVHLSRTVSQDDLNFVVNVASRYSPWTATTAANGYITAPGGHRIGICGTATVKNGKASGISVISSLCLRVARDFPGIARGVPNTGSVLILGAPGTGKTTLLRDLIRRRSAQETVAVVDERCEIFPYVNGVFCFPQGEHTDVLSCCGKMQGIDTVLRCMTPKVIAVDEITEESDCNAIIHANWCGANLLATAHADSAYDLRKRPIYRPLIDASVFDCIIVLHQDKSWHAERTNV